MILCCGEALIDMVPVMAGAVPAFAPHSGGAVFNTAIGLGRLGARVGFLCGMSRDLFGQRLAADLAASGVDSSFCPRVDRPTTLAFVTLRDGQAEYAFYDEASALRMLSDADLPELPDAVQALFFGGISLVAEPCGSTYEAFALRAAGRVLVMLDPNIRTGFIRDEAAYRARLARMIAAADVVKLSVEDLAWLMGPGDLMAQAQQVLGQGPAVVLITDGGAGAHLLRGSDHIHLPAPKVGVVDTVGAGDTFNAG
ncbi:MAG: carbohydrate kinase, partial [Gemmobacter sp.]|nr:carbohydrate kinase [Gemmobacter sp.]